jgi:hypothetical protein
MENSNIETSIANLESISQLLSFYFSVTTLPLAVFLNLLAYFIFGKSSLNNKTNLGFLYRVLSFSAIVSLVIQIVFNILTYMNINVFTYSQFNCKFFTFLTITVTHIPSFIQVLIAIELHILVVHPTKTSHFNRLSYSFAIFFICLVLVGLNSFNFTFSISDDNSGLNSSSSSLTYNNSSDDNNSTLSEQCETSDIMDLVADAFNILLRALIPFIILFVIDFLTIQCLIESKRKMHTVGITKNGFDRKVSSFAMATIWMNVIFLVMYIPWMVSFFVYDGFFFTNGWRIDWQVAICILFSTICNCIANLNYFTIFFSNLIFNRLFQKEFRRIFFLNATSAGNQSEATNCTPGALNRASSFLYPKI